MSFGSPREAQTTLPCPLCAQPLLVTRSCFEVQMYCPHCKKNFPVDDFVRRMDDALESFMENVYCNRI